MADSIFTKIIKGDEPGEVLYSDERAFIILSRAPHRPGHSLVVPRMQIEHFEDLTSDDFCYLTNLSRKFALVLQEVFLTKVVALQIMGLGVDHTHIHLVPINDEHDMDQANGVFVDIEALSLAAKSIRTYLAEHPISEVQ